MEALGAERKIVQNAVFRGKRHDNKILKVQIFLSRNFVVMAQAPRYPLLQGLSLDCNRPFYGERNGGVATPVSR